MVISIGSGEYIPVVASSPYRVETVYPVETCEGKGAGGSTVAAGDLLVVNGMATKSAATGSGGTGDVAGVVTPSHVYSPAALTITFTCHVPQIPRFSGDVQDSVETPGVVGTVLNYCQFGGMGRSLEV